MQIITREQAIRLVELKIAKIPFPFPPDIDNGRIETYGLLRMYRYTLDEMLELAGEMLEAKKHPMYDKEFRTLQEFYYYWDKSISKPMKAIDVCYEWLCYLKKKE